MRHTSEGPKFWNRSSHWSAGNAFILYTYDCRSSQSATNRKDEQHLIPHSFESRSDWLPRKRGQFRCLLHCVNSSFKVLVGCPLLQWKGVNEDSHFLNVWVWRWRIRWWSDQSAWSSAVEVRALIIVCTVSVRKQLMCWNIGPRTSTV